MLRVTYTIGTQYRWNGKPIWKDTRDTWIHQALKRIALTFGGYTANAGRGGWINSQEELIEEECLTIVVLTDLGHKPEFETTAVYLGEQFGQDCVVMTIDETEVKFI
jgi:hypothetical protein